VTVSNARADKEDRTLSSTLLPTHMPNTAPKPRHATNDARSGDDDRTSDGPQAIVVEDSTSNEGSEGSDEEEATEEEDDAELGMCSIILCYIA
jgi:hypothetical protein